MDDLTKPQNEEIMKLEDIMELAKEQVESAQSGNVVRVQTDTGEIVIVSAEVFDQLAGLSYDELDPRDTYPAVLKAWDAEGRPDDETAYQDLL